MRISSATSERLRAIGFLCALLMVPIHCPTIAAGASAAKWIVALQTLGCDTVSRLAVPWFFVVSGFFLCRGLSAEDAARQGKLSAWITAVRKRTLTLLVPYLLWNAVYYAFKIATGKYGFAPWHCLDQLTGLDPYDVPACGQLWYVRCLFVYVLAAPAFLLATRRWPWAAAVALFAAWFADAPQCWRYVQYADWSYLAYFASGFALARTGFGCDGRDAPNVGMAKFAVAGLFAASAAAVTWCAVTGNDAERGLASKLMIVSGLPTLWFAGDWIAKTLQPLRGFWTFGFFVYAAHVMAVSIARKAFAAFLHGAAYDSVGYLGIIAVGVACPLALAAAMKKCCPKALGLLCGGRA